MSGFMGKRRDLGAEEEDTGFLYLLKLTGLGTNRRAGVGEDN